MPVHIPALENVLHAAFGGVKQFQPTGNQHVAAGEDARSR